MNRSSLFNNDSICIFTDASFHKNEDCGNFSIGSVCSGACVYWNGLLIDECFHIMHNTTVQRGELYAILLGVLMAYKYRFNYNMNRFYNLRIFSDSQTSIFAIRDRIFKWVEDTKKGLNVLGRDGSIKNQDLIMDIIDTIISNGIPIEFYHVKGHVNPNNYGDIKNAKRVFISSNRINKYVDDSLIYQVSEGNDQVDRYTGYMLNRYLDDQKFKTDGLIPAISYYGYHPFNITNYKNLIK